MTLPPLSAQSDIRLLLRLYLHHATVERFLWLWTAVVVLLGVGMVLSDGNFLFRGLLAIVVVVTMAEAMCLLLAIDALDRYREYLHWRARPSWNPKTLACLKLAGLAGCLLLLFFENYGFLVIGLLPASFAYVWSVAPALTTRGHHLSFGRRRQPDSEDLILLGRVGAVLGFDVAARVSEGSG